MNSLKRALILILPAFDPSGHRHANAKQLALKLCATNWLAGQLVQMTTGIPLMNLCECFAGREQRDAAERWVSRPKALHSILCQSAAHRSEKVLGAVAQYCCHQNIPQDGLYALLQRPIT